MFCKRSSGMPATAKDRKGEQVTLQGLQYVLLVAPFDRMSMDSIDSKTGVVKSFD
jgi:hypothetical protein